MKKYFVTVDTGGTKTHISAFDNTGQLLSRLDCPGVGVIGTADLAELTDKLEQLGTVVPLECVSNVVVNLGGANTKQIQNAVSPLFPNAETEVYRESSGVLMKAICHMENADVLIMAGTGIICLANGKKGSIITDAWGPSTGDKGSGYWIGVEAISRSLIALEGEGELPPLAKHITGRDVPFSAVENTMDIMHLRDEVRKNFMPLERTKAASFAKVAADYARSGDTFANDIFLRAGEMIAYTALRGIGLAGCTAPANVLVSGGLAGCYDLWGDAFEQTLKSQTECVCRVGELDMTQGMLYYITKQKRGI